MASSKRKASYDLNSALEMILADESDDESTMGMDEDEEYELDRQLGVYSDESR